MNRPALMPKDTPDVMVQAWLDCLRWAIGNKDILTSFRKQTGSTWTPGAAPIDRMIDESSGADRKFVEEFVAWFNENVWGPMDAHKET